MIHFTSDTHWFHSSVLRYSNRPFADVTEMDEALIENWNSVVKPKDTVYHLGDVAFGKRSKIKTLLERLNGHKHLILGNHDREIEKRPAELTGTGLFESIQHYKELRQDPLIVMFHYSGRTWNKAHYGSIMLYGHSHGSSKPYGRSLDVGVDCKEVTNEYRPISLDEVLEYMRTREYVKMDRH